MKSLRLCLRFFWPRSRLSPDHPQTGVYLSTDMVARCFPPVSASLFVDPGSHGQVGTPSSRVLRH